MTKRLVPLGFTESTVLAVATGKGMTPRSLSDRMPSSDIAAKVGSAPASGLAPYLGDEASVVRRNARV